MLSTQRIEVRAALVSCSQKARFESSEYSKIIIWKCHPPSFCKNKYLKFIKMTQLNANTALNHQSPQNTKSAIKICLLSFCCPFFTTIAIDLPLIAQATKFNMSPNPPKSVIIYVYINLRCGCLLFWWILVKAEGFLSDENAELNEIHWTRWRSFGSVSNLFGAFGTWLLFNRTDNKVEIKHLEA